MEHEITKEFIDLLMYAVAKQAIKDYVALKNGYVQPSKICNQTELKEYFRSELFEHAFPNLNGEKIIEILDDSEKSEQIFARITKEERWKKERKQKVRLWK